MMRMGINVGIYPDCNIGCLSQGRRNGAYNLHLGLRLHIQTAYTGFKCGGYLAVGLPYSGKKDPPGSKSCIKRSLQLTAAHDISP